MREAMGLPPEEQEVSDAASKLGKKGAAAKKAKATEPVVESTDKEPEAEEEEKPKEEAKADEEDDKAEDKPKETKEEAQKRKQGARERVLEATRKEAEAKRIAREKDAEVQKLRAELEALKAPKKEVVPATKTAKAAPEDDPEPDHEDAEKYPEGRFDPQYIKDLGRHAARQEAREHDSKRQEKERTENFGRAVKELHAKSLEAVEKAGGDAFLKEMSDDVLTLEPSFFALERGERPGPLNALADEVLRAGEHGPRLMRYLTDNPDVIQRVSTLQPHEAGKFERIMGTIEAKLGDANAGAPPPKLEVSKAKPPVRPVTGSPKTDSEELDDDAPLSAHVARFAQREMQLRGR